MHHKDKEFEAVTACNLETGNANLSFSTPEPLEIRNEIEAHTANKNPVLFSDFRKGTAKKDEEKPNRRYRSYSL